MHKRIKVVWLCGFTNEYVFNELKPHYGKFELFIRKLLRKPLVIRCKELAVWVTNAIHEFEKFTNEIELHIVAAQGNLGDEIVEFNHNGIYYHIVNDELNYFSSAVARKIFPQKENSDYIQNRKRFSLLINRINPDVVHLIGAENPNYSLGILDVKNSIPTIVQLQTLMQMPGFEDGYPISHRSFLYRSGVEKTILENATYIASAAKTYIEYIRQHINKSAVCLNTTLALAEPINLSESKKEFDFVYFSKEVEKAGDYALEAFVLAFKKYPWITMDIIGDCSESYKDGLKNILKAAGAEKAVKFEGVLPTHEDVIKQVRKSRFAVIPMKVDLMTGTIRESMANGLPVCTTKTSSTLRQNSIRKCLLLSESGDHNALAENMCRLLNDNDLGDTLRNNAAQSLSERDSNEKRMEKWVQMYKAVLLYENEDVPIPQALLHAL